MIWCDSLILAGFVSSTTRNMLYDCDPRLVSCSPQGIGSRCCVPEHGLMVLALQWLPGYCKATGGRCTHDVLDRIPKDKWTIHGLWPDSCDELQVSFCDTSREYTDVAYRMRESQIYDNLTTNWVSYKGGRERDFNDFWGHEWQKHGTCYSPSELQCVGSHSKYADLEKFFQDTLHLQSKYDIHRALQNSNIIPSKNLIYKSADIKAALVKEFGPLSIGLVCKGPYLAEIRLGLVGTAKDVAKNADFNLPSTCPRYGVKFAEEHTEHSNDVSFDFLNDLND